MPQKHDIPIIDTKENNDLKETKRSAKCPHCSGRHKERSAQEQRSLITRLKKIEGQIRGIEKMVENDIYCPDILIQVSAATSALNSFNRMLLSRHIKSCVVNDIKAGKEETVDELCGVIQKLMK